MGETKIEWREIPGFPGYYASPTGAILSRKGRRPRILRPIKARDGHLYVFLYRGGKGWKTWVHRAILIAFDREPQDGEECRHLDGDPSHNRFENLAWGSRLENVADKKRHGTQPRHEKSGTHKLTAADVLEIRRLHGKYSLRALAARYGVSHTAVRRAALGIKWAGLKGAGLNE